MLRISEIGLVAHRALALEAIEKLRGKLTGPRQALGEEFAVFWKLRDIRHSLSRRNTAPAREPDTDVRLKSDASPLPVAADIASAFKLLRPQPVHRPVNFAVQFGLVHRPIIVALNEQ